MKWLIVALVAATGLTACAPVVHYHPKPIAPAATAAQLEGRSLSDPGLRRFMETNLHHKLATWPLKSWDLDDLALAGYYFNPQMQIARAQAEAARAAIITAGERPNPTFRMRPGIPSPYLYTLDLLFTIQTEGRRKIMVEQAKDLTAAARLNLAQASWKVYSNVRASLVSYFLATREVSLLKLEQRLQTHRVSLLRARFVAGDISRPTVDDARLSLLQTHVAIQAAEGRIPETRAAIAAAIGVPVTALNGIQLVWPDFSRPLNAKSISSQSIQRDAVLNRLDVRKALAEYAAAQEALQLQIARQYSNILIGPGYSISGDYFRLRYAVTLPIFNRNQGPIAQAEAQRKEAAAAFLTTQANAIAQSEEALARYRDAWRQLHGTDEALMEFEHVFIPKERRTVAAGEAGRLALNAVLLQRPGMAQTWLTALGRTQTALGTLENAVQRPLDPDEMVLPARSAPSKQDGLKTYNSSKPAVKKRGAAGSQMRIP